MLTTPFFQGSIDSSVTVSGITIKNNIIKDKYAAHSFARQ